MFPMMSHSMVPCFELHVRSPAVGMTHGALLRHV